MQILNNQMTRQISTESGGVKSVMAKPFWRWSAWLLTGTGLLCAGNVEAKEAKKTRGFTVSREIDAPADSVWKVVGEDFGAIAYSHPKIVTSEYVDGSLQGGEGAERVCYFNDKKTKFVQEKQIEFSPENFRFKAQIFHADGLPLDEDVTYAVYDVDPIDENRSRLSIEMVFRTDPAFLGFFAKGRFKKTLADYLLAVEHHVKTGEKVTKDNFKQIKKHYRS